MAGWDTLAGLVKFEVLQRSEEGYNTEGYAELVAAAGHDEKKLLELYKQLKDLPVRADFTYSEPSELEEIRTQRPEGPRKLAADWSDQQWQDKFYGAWLGRSIGCALGKPLETGPFVCGTEQQPGWWYIHKWFADADAWPITGFTPSVSRAAETYGIKLPPASRQSERDYIQYMQSDDDIRYTVLGLSMLESKGLDWDTWDMGVLWHDQLSYGQVCTAEKQAYLNFAHVTSYTESFARPADWQQRIKWVRTHLNPYREWIGAQIRVDGLAYGAAANPQLAADLAWRDASLSHEKNGIYGAMFIAAMIAAAFVEQDVVRIVEIGLSEIPANCRLASDVKQAVSIALEAESQLELVERIWNAYKHYGWIHTNNNASLVAAALVYSRGDFEQAITTAVLGGWDTDCNGATIGSIVGAMNGAAAIPASWKEPLHDTLYGEIVGFHPIAISACAERSRTVFNKLR